jgi:hypothetical protein
MARVPLPPLVIGFCPSLCLSKTIEEASKEEATRSRKKRTAAEYKPFDLYEILNYISFNFSIMAIFA